MDDNNNQTTEAKANENEENPDEDKAGPSTATISRKIENKHKNLYKYEPAPSKRSRVARKLIQKMRHIIYEYSVKTGEQISGVFVEKPTASCKDYKIYGTKPLVTVMDSFKCAMNEKYVTEMNNEKLPTSEIEKRRLPPLQIDGIDTKLEYFTQSQLRAFIPRMIKAATGRQYTGWNNPSFRPEWWPQDLNWFSVRFDRRPPDAKKQEKWTSTLQRIIKNCYSYYGCEDMLNGNEIHELPQNVQDKQGNIENSTVQNVAVENMETNQLVPVENFQTFQILGRSSVFQLPENASHLHDNVMYLIQNDGSSTSVLHPIQIVPAVNLVDVTNSISDCNAEATENEMEVAVINDVSENMETVSSSVDISID